MRAHTIIKFVGSQGYDGLPMNSNPERTTALAVCCTYLTRGSQAAVARIAGKPGILQAAGSGDIALVQDHLIANGFTRYLIHRRALGSQK
jgi:hypothetical protein